MEMKIIKISMTLLLLMLFNHAWFKTHYAGQYLDQYYDVVEALAWRLSDVRNGVNKEARYSFEAFGQMRPAYYLIQKNNSSNP